MEVNFSLVPPGWAPNADLVPESAYESGEQQMTNWINDRITKLKELNRDNSRLESCSIRLSGNEKIRPGRWLTVQKKDAAFMYYATRVEHEIVLWHSFTTTVTGERGERRSGDGSYRPELDLKGALK